VILAANNQQILRFTIRTYPLKPHIMERVFLWFVVLLLFTTSNTPR
jgi:hypothetical protein